MYLRNGLPYNLGASSRRLYDAIAASLPYLLQFARAEQVRETDGLSLYIEAPSPTGDPQRPFVIWVDEKVTPSIGFGPDHCHEHDDAEGVAALLDWADAILNDEVVVIEPVDRAHPWRAHWIDLREPDELEDELTSPARRTASGSRAGRAIPTVRSASRAWSPDRVTQGWRMGGMVRKL